jgi:small-conductance mechanosensitive channel
MSAAVEERPARAAQAKRNLQKEREKLLARLQQINRAIEEAGAAPGQTENSFGMEPQSTGARHERF